jgi:hypothetical protein
MNNNVRLEWVSALRSGQYIKTEGALRNDKNNYCTLGVLCSLYIQDNPGRASWIVEDGQYKFAETYGSTVATVHEGADLPNVVMHWAGLNKQDPVFLLPNSEDGEVSIVSANDDSGDEDFESIATLLEFGAEKRRP